MIFRRLIIALFAVSIIPILWLEADATTTTCTAYRVIAGSNTCVRWTTGSEICNVKISGLQGGLGEGGEAVGVDVTCEAFGAGGPGTQMTGSLFCAIPNDSFSAATVDEGCKHNFNGVGTGHTTNADNPGHAGDCNVFRNVTTNVTGGVDISQTVPLTQCDRKGVCQATAELNDPGDGQQLCNDNGGGTFVSFTADSFCANVQVCDLPGTEGCQFIDQLCTLAGNGYNCVPPAPGQCGTE